MRLTVPQVEPFSLPGQPVLEGTPLLPSISKDSVPPTRGKGPAFRRVSDKEKMPKWFKEKQKKDSVISHTFSTNPFTVTIHTHEETPEGYSSSENGHSHPHAHISGDSLIPSVSLPHPSAPFPPASQEIPPISQGFIPSPSYPPNSSISSSSHGQYSKHLSSYPVDSSPPLLFSSLSNGYYNAPPSFKISPEETSLSSTKIYSSLPPETSLSSTKIYSSLPPETSLSSTKIHSSLPPETSLSSTKIHSSSSSLPLDTPSYPIKMHSSSSSSLPISPPENVLSSLYEAPLPSPPPPSLQDSPPHIPPFISLPASSECYLPQASFSSPQYFEKVSYTRELSPSALCIEKSFEMEASIEENSLSLSCATIPTTKYSSFDEESRLIDVSTSCHLPLKQRSIVHSSASYSLMKSQMGAFVVDKSKNICAFRLWSPHLHECWVEIDEERFPLTQEDSHSYWSVQVAPVYHGDAYHFILNSSWNDCYHEEGELLQRCDPYARQLLPEKGYNVSCIVDYSLFHWSPFDETSIPWKELIIYELHPKTFVSYTKNRSICEVMIDGLEHIVNLGFTAVELLPVQEFSGLWGYSSRLLLAIHTAYGTPLHYQMFVDACHTHKLKVIQDINLNHGSSKDNLLWNWDGYGCNKEGGIYFEGGHDSGWGKAFAFHKKEVRDYIKAAALMFFKDYHVDGLRMDSVHNMPWNLLQEITSELKAMYPSKIIIAEITPENSTVCSKAGFDGCWIHSVYYDAMKIIRNQDRKHHMAMLKNMISLHDGFSFSHQCIKSILGSHDQAGNRRNGETDGKANLYLVELLGGRQNWHARAQCRMWYALQAMSRGIPMLFMGSELHQDKWWNVEASRCMKWSLIEDKDMSTLHMMQMVRDIHKLRRSYSEFTDETEAVEFFHIDERNCVIGFKRGNRFLIVLNCGENQWDRNEYCLRSGWKDGEIKQCFNSQDELYGGWKESWTFPSSSPPFYLTPEMGGILSLTLPKWSLTVFMRL
ncbi:alpha amylase, catalytic domain-containing protein [Cardiosporidium cionae]|uniref:1,4-alpha-glucan branching enzyme n=1 Tax=Cardiosporidium cionae TaxID=476202 RepID=A0ABQ7J744_9APIC|nr:alpha amylase, catalytic domain-containing protein [Cardiosporidium cionae]|eukprot:KAF8819808.1 alpha amylase, catalytic domain-containing protein [Cardiosporidium cionae]